jgi:Arc/MetJ-type ribon-helix-helix transcriptional regulator
MAIFDYSNEAELSPTASEVELAPIRHRKTRQPIGYGRFARAADAIRFAIEELPPELLMAAQLKVADQRFSSDAIRRLYESGISAGPTRCSPVSKMNRHIPFGST